MNTYDVFGLGQLIDRGLSRKLELIESALMQLDSSLEPITIVESFAFVVNTSNFECYRIKYEVNEGIVTFTNPTPFVLNTDLSSFENKSKKIVRNIVESISKNSEPEVEYYKAQWLANERQVRVLESKLNLTVGTKSQYLNNAKKIVSESVKAVRGAKSLIAKGRNKSLLNKLLRENKVDIRESQPRVLDTDKSRKQLIYTKIVETRRQAQSLTESPVFAEYVSNIYEGTDVSNAAEFIVNNYQEIFTLSLAEQTELFYAIVESKVAGKPSLETVVGSVMTVGKAAMSNSEIVEELQKISTLIEATNGNYHERMQLIESEMNTHNFSTTDLKTIQAVLEGIIAQPSEFLAPEFVTECRRMYRKVINMSESGNVDDALVAAAVHLISQFYPQPIGEKLDESGKSEKSEAYQKYFQGKLDQYDVKSPADLSDEEKKKFFDEVDAGWTAEDDGKKGKKEDVDSQTGFPDGELEKLTAKAKRRKNDETPPSDDPDMQDAESVEALENLGSKGKRKSKKEDGVEANPDDDVLTLPQLKAKFSGMKGKASVEQLDSLSNAVNDIKTAGKSKKEDEEADDLMSDIETEKMISKK
jgi:hypothetical protein